MRSPCQTHTYITHTYNTHTKHTYIYIYKGTGLWQILHIFGIDLCPSNNRKPQHLVRPVTSALPLSQISLTSGLCPKQFEMNLGLIERCVTRAHKSKVWNHACCFLCMCDVFLVQHDACFLSTKQEASRITTFWQVHVSIEI